MVVIPKEGRALPSFGITQTFQKKNFFLNSKKSVSYQKKGAHARPSFGMTTTQDIRERSLFMGGGAGANRGGDINFSASLKFLKQL